MKKYILVLFFAMCAAFTSAQQPTFSWIKNYFNGSQRQQINGIYGLPNGDIIIRGYSHTPSSLGLTDTFFDGTLINYDDYWARSFVARVNDQGTILWHKNICGNSNLGADPPSITSDKNGHIYIAGVNHNLAPSFGFNIGEKRGFVIELDSSGKFVGIDTFDVRNTTTLITSIAVDDSLNKYVAGYASNGLVYNGTSIPKKSRVDGFLLKIGADHKLKWSEVIGITGNTSAGAQSSIADVDIDSKGDIIITGNCGGGNVEFDTIKTGLTSGRDYFIAKYAPNGSVRWVHQGTSSGTIFMDDRAYEIELDANDNIYCTGVFAFKSTGISPQHADLNFGGDTTKKVWAYYEGDIVTGVVSRTGFILKTDPNGQTLWGHRFGGSASDFVSQGTDMYLSSTISKTGVQSEGFPSQKTLVNVLDGSRNFISKIDMGTGEFSTGRLVATMENNNNTWLSLGIANNKLYAAGHFKDTYYFGTDSIESIDPGREEDAFLGQIGDVSYPKINAPVNVKFLSATTTSIDFGWTDNSNNETGFVAVADGTPYLSWGRVYSNFVSENAVSASIPFLLANQRYDLYAIPHYNFEVIGDTSSSISDSTFVHVGLDDAELVPEVELFPVPVVNALLNINSHEPLTIRFYELGGQLLFTKSIATGRTSLDLFELQSGIYLIEVEGSNSRVISKLPVLH